MKIAVAGTRGFPDVQGGVEKHCEHLYPRLAVLGCEITTFVRSPYVSHDRSAYKGVNLIVLNCPQSKHLEAIVHTARAVFRARKFAPDILHIQSIGPSLFAPLARMMGMCVVVTNHGENYKHKKWGFLARLFLRICEVSGALFAHQLIAISPPIAQLLHTKYGKEAAVIPNGVEIPDQAVTDGALTMFGLERGKYILAVGRFVPEKGFHDLIEAFRMADRQGWKLVIVGRADHEDAYSIDLRNQASLSTDVILTGFQKGQPLHELYSHAGLFVLPSYYEGLPIVLLEAMSYGLSCIASDIPANRNVVLPDGRFFLPGDVSALREKIEVYLRQPLAKAEREAQRAMIAERFNWDTIAEQTMAVYVKAMRERQ